MNDFEEKITEELHEEAADAAEDTAETAEEAAEFAIKAAMGRTEKGEPVSVWINGILPEEEEGEEQNE